MIRRAGLLLIAVLCGAAALAATPRLNVHGISEIDSLQRVEKRPVLVFIYTDWCRYCHAMEQTTFRNSEVAKALNDKYWFAKLNAEAQEDISFGGRTYRYRPTGGGTGIHELAELLGTVEGRVSYPTTCLLAADGHRQFAYTQYMPAKDLLRVLKEAAGAMP